MISSIVYIFNLTVTYLNWVVKLFSESNLSFLVAGQSKQPIPST